MRTRALFGIGLLTACGPQLFFPDAAVAPDAGPPPHEVYPDAPECGQSVPIMIEENLTPPDVLFVVDKSGSMSKPLVMGSTTTKWQIMREALRLIVEAEDENIFFGLM